MPPTHRIHGNLGRRTSPHRGYRIAPTLLVFSFAACSRVAFSETPTATHTRTCQLVGYHQLDFLIGKWNIYNVSGQRGVVARARIDPVLNHCVLHVMTEGMNGTDGQAFSIFDPSRGRWHQTWVTNQGSLLEVEGNWQNGRLVLNGSPAHKGGNAIRVRISLWSVDDKVRELGESSMDNGKSWHTNFNFIFRRGR